MLNYRLTYNEQKTFQISQLDAIDIFCRNKVGYEKWAKEWVKMKVLHTEITPICKFLQQSMKQCNQNSIAINLPQ
jgi:hypothetical protein